MARAGARHAKVLALAGVANLRRAVAAHELLRVARLPARVRGDAEHRARVCALCWRLYTRRVQKLRIVWGSRIGACCVGGVFFLKQAGAEICRARHGAPPPTHAQTVRGLVVSANFYTGCEVAVRETLQEEGG